jgi:UDP-N-acetylmuramate dehydrogenase
MHRFTAWWSASQQELGGQSLPSAKRLASLGLSHAEAAMCQIQCDDLTITTKAQLGHYSALGIGGSVDYLLKAKNNRGIIEGLRFARDHGPLHVIGAGSNTLISDHGITGCVLQIAGGTAHFQPHGLLVAQAGVPMPMLSRLAAKYGYSGLEWAEGIPGRVGGAVAMNAGAFKGAMADSVVGVEAFDPAGTRVVLDRADLSFGHRSSSLQGSGLVISSVALQLTVGDQRAICAQMQRHREYRGRTQPVGRTLGSTFKQVMTADGPRSAGYILEKAGFKGYSIGKVGFSEVHANFLMNLGKGSFEDAEKLIALAVKTVKKQFDLSLELEIRLIL